MGAAYSQKGSVMMGGAVYSTGSVIMLATRILFVRDRDGTFYFFDDPLGMGSGISIFA